MCLVLLAARQDAFFALSSAAATLREGLARSGTSAAIRGVLQQVRSCGPSWSLRPFHIMALQPQCIFPGMRLPPSRALCTLRWHGYPEGAYSIP